MNKDTFMCLVILLAAIAACSAGYPDRPLDSSQLRSAKTQADAAARGIATSPPSYLEPSPAPRASPVADLQAPPQPEECSFKVHCVVIIAKQWIYMPAGDGVVEGMQVIPEQRRIRRLRGPGMQVIRDADGSLPVTDLYWLATTPDGLQVFGAGRQESRVAVFDRDTDSGMLKYSGVREFRDRTERDMFMADLDWGVWFDFSHRSLSDIGIRTRRGIEWRQTLLLRPES